MRGCVRVCGMPTGRLEKDSLRFAGTEMPILVGGFRRRATKEEATYLYTDILIQ